MVGPPRATGTRILILNERDPGHPKTGGAETHVSEIFGRLAHRGFQVTSASSGFDGGAREEEIAGIRVLRLAGLPLYYPKAARYCARETGAGHYDLVVECLNKLPFLSPLYARVPVLGLCHHLFGSTAFEQVPWPVAATVWAVERTIPFVFRRQHMVTISESTRDDLVQRGMDPSRVEVHHPGIRRPARAPLPVAERRPRIVFVGRLERYKHVDVMLRAAVRLVGRFPALEITVVGKGADRPRLERIAGELGLSQRTRFVGFVSDAERDALIGDARVCVCPSAKEGWGLTVVEANALGTPNVASDVPGLRDSVRDGETGFLVPEGDVASFADRIGDLLGDDVLASRMSEAAAAWSGRFDWETAADQMEEAVARALVAAG